MLLLEGGRVCCPATGNHARADVLVDGGRIVDIGLDLIPDTTEVSRLDCSGSVVGPGLIDLSAHLCDPGDAARGTLTGGAQVAAAGGFTTVLAAPDTQPVIDNATVDLSQDPYFVSLNSIWEYVPRRQQNNEQDDVITLQLGINGPMPSAR